ncbi:tail fiber domain-containing protein [Cronobacter dublinensis]
MAKGTISIANGATAITGEGTTFKTELAAGDYIVFTAGQVVYTLAIKSVDSDEALTLTKPYTGPDAAGLAWSAVPRSTMNQITMEVVNQVTEALRGLNHDKDNWQQVFSESNNVTVTLPDGSEFKGPSWPFIVNLLEELDPEKLQQLVDDMKASQDSVSADRTAAEAARDKAQAAANSAAASQKAAEDAEAIATKNATDATTSASAAADSAASASQAATEARSQAERAEELADTLDAENFLKKDQNLADVSSITTAKENLAINRLEQAPNETRIRNAKGEQYLVVTDSGEWGSYKDIGDSKGWVALGVTQGGTGAKDVTTARNNLGLGVSDNVEFSRIKGNGDIYTRMISDDAVRGNALISEIVGTDGETKSRIELWCDTSTGNASVVNRNPTGPRFFTIKQNGEVEPSGRIMSGYGAELKHNGEALTLRPSGADQATFLLIRDNDNTNVTLFGRASASYDTVINNYKHGTSLALQASWSGCNKAWYASGIESRNGVLRAKAGNTEDIAVLQLANTDGRLRGVVFCPRIADGQYMYFRADNSSTGAAGQSMSLNGATGEVRGVKFTSTSDERAKFWIKPVTGALDKICQLNGITYSMHTTIQNTVRNAGLIAQDVQKVLPEAVTECITDHSTIDKDCQAIENPLALDYNALSALYVEAFKEVKAELDACKSELAELKAAVASLMASGSAANNSVDNGD